MVRLSMICGFLTGIPGCFTEEDASQVNKQPLVIAPDHGPGQMLEFDPDILDLGSAKSGETVLGEVEIRNCSSAPITIQRIQASCGCSVAEMPTAPIESNSKIILPVKISTHGKQGQLRSLFQVWCSNGSQETVTSFECKLKVFPAIALASVPSAINLGDLKKGSEVNFDFQLKVPSEITEEGEVIGATSNGWLKVLIGDCESLNGSLVWSGHVYGKVPDAAGPLKQAIQIRSRGLGANHLSIPVSGNVQGSLVLDPTSVVKVVDRDDLTSTSRFDFKFRQRLEQSGIAKSYEFDVSGFSDAVVSVKGGSADGVGKAKVHLESWATHGKRVLKGDILIRSLLKDKTGIARLPVVFVAE